MRKSVTTADAAKILSVDTSRVRQLLITKELEGQKIGRDWVVWLSSVNARKRKLEAKERARKRAKEKLAARA